MMLAVHEILALWLLWTCFCRAVHMSSETRMEIRLSFWWLGIAACVALAAPWRDWQPDWVTIWLLLAICIVQTVTARLWREGVPLPFRKG